MYSETLSILERLVKHPLYYLSGISGKHLLYISTLEGSTDLWSSALDGEDQVKLAERVAELSRPRHDDKRILYASDVSEGKELHKIYSIEVGGGEPYEAFDMEPIRVFGIAHYNDVIAYSGASKRENALYLAKEYDRAEKTYSTDKLIFATAMDDNYVVGAGTLAGDPRSMEIFIYSLNDNEFHIYTPKEGSFNTPSMMYKGKILFTSNFEGRKKLYLYDIRDERLEEPIFNGEKYREYEFGDYQNYGFTEDGRIWFIGIQEYRGYAFLDGYKIYHPEGTPENIDIYSSEIYMGFSSLKTPNSIYRTGLDDDERWIRIVGEDLDKDIVRRLGDIKIVKYRSFDGLDIPTIIYEADNRKPGPTILYIHGGPWSHVGDFWRIFMIGLVASGFHVVAPNFRGSTGYGEGFRILDIGDPGGGDLKDIVYAREYALKSGLADKIAIMGYSYGGFMAYLATTREPGLWDAAVAGAGIVDWEMMYDLADAAFKHFQEMLFDGNTGLWRDRSAVNFTDKLKAPLCILHPQNDTRTPLKPVLRYMEKLTENNKTFEAHIFPNMGHVITRLDDALKLLYPAIIFLKKTLGS